MTTAMRRIGLSMAFVLTTLFAAGYASADIILNDVARGSYTNTGVFGTGGAGTSDGNYLTGYYSSLLGTEFRSFFTFDLSRVSGEITSAKLNVPLGEVYQYGYGNRRASLDLFPYSGNINRLDNGTAGTDGFDDLGFGSAVKGTLKGAIERLGSAYVYPSDTGTLSIDLRTAPIVAAESGKFAIGGSVEFDFFPTAMFGHTHFPYGSPIELVLSMSAVPEPSILSMAGTTALFGLIAYHRRNRASA